MRAFIRRHPAASYFLLAIVLSWGGIVAVIWPPDSIPASPAEAERLFTRVYLAMLAGPSVGGLAIAAIADGGNGLRAYRERLLAWRVGGRWYAMALFTAPVAIALVLLALSVVSPDFTSVILSSRSYEGAGGLIHAESEAMFLLTGLAVGIGAGLFEELGWTGVAVPKMLGRRGLLATGLAVGIVWGAWHFLAIYWGGGNAMGTVPAPMYLLVALFSFLPPYRILMVWVYQHTRSLLIAILMHASLTSSMLILGPAVSGRDLLTYDLTLAVLFWIAALVVLAVERRRTRPAAIRAATSLPASALAG